MKRLWLPFGGASHGPLALGEARWYTVNRAMERLMWQGTDVSSQQPAGIWGLSAATWASVEARHPAVRPWAVHSPCQHRDYSLVRDHEPKLTQLVLLQQVTPTPGNLLELQTYKPHQDLQIRNSGGGKCPLKGFWCKVEFSDWESVRWRYRQIRERQGAQAVLVLLCVLGWRVREQTSGLGKLSLNPGSGSYQPCDFGQVSFLNPLLFLHL